MRMKLKRYAWVLALVLAVGISGVTVRAVASPTMNGAGQDQDYSRNKNYQQGMRDGREDRAHNRDHYKKRHFKKDEDQKAYEAGYQRGRAGDHDHDR